MSRRYKLPVISRLTWAWLGFATLCGLVAAYAASDWGRTRAAVAMAVEGIERIAPPLEARSSGHSPVERLSPAYGDPSPDLVATNGLESADAEDTLADISDPFIPRDDSAAEIVITVDGAPARAIGAAPISAPAFLPVASPDPELLRRSVYGKIPRIGVDGRKPSKVYAQPFAQGDQAEIALIVGGLGLNRALTERAIDELPPHVTLAFAPYAKDLPFWTKRARDSGHEVMIEIPMENRAGDGEALGPAALLTSRSDQENAQRLEWILARFQGYFGVTNYLGAKFAGDRDAMEKFVSRINQAGLAYIDDTGALSRMGAESDATSVDRLIDPGYGTGKRLAKRDLEFLEKLALQKGEALGKTYLHDETLGDIVDWAGSLEQRGFTLAPASAVLALRSDTL